jgi:hypothetical protein
MDLTGSWEENVRKKRLIQKDKFGALARMRMVEPVADTPLAKRMVESEGPEMLSLMKTFQQEFGARLVWLKDGQGEVGKKPGWVDEPR